MVVNDFARFNGLLTTLDELYESLYSAMRLAPTAYFANIDDITKEDFKAFSAGELMLGHRDMFNVQAQMRCLNALKVFIVLLMIFQAGWRASTLASFY